MAARSALLSGLAPLLAATAALAEAREPPLTLTMNAPPECPSRHTLQAEVLRLARVEPESKQRLTAEITVERAGSRFSLRLRTELAGVTGERNFDGNTCQAVSDAAALTLALMLNPDVETSADPPAAESEPAPRAAPAVSEPAEPKPKPPPARARSGGPSLEGAAAVHAGAQIGILPAPGPELGAALGLSLRPVTAWLGLSYAPAQDATLATSQHGGRLWAGAASLLGCWALLDRPSATLGPCGGAELHRLEGRGQGVSDPETGVIFWTSAVLGVACSVRLAPRLHLQASVQGLAPLAEPSVFLEDLGQIHAPAAVLGRARAGVALDLW